MSRYTTGAQEWESMNVADTHIYMLDDKSDV